LVRKLWRWMSKRILNKHQEGINWGIAETDYLH
jgi:hypothetical protein